MSNTAVFGIYRDRDCLDRALDVLKRAGFRHTDVSMLLPENPGTMDLAFEKGTRAPEGAVAGSAAGALIAAVLAWLVSDGRLKIPGLDPLIIIGPLWALLSGIGAGGLAGAVAGALIGSTAPKYEAKRYDGQIRRGAILMSVHCDRRDWISRARRILKDTGAQDIAAAAEARADFLNSDRPLPRHATAQFEDFGMDAAHSPSSAPGKPVAEPGARSGDPRSITD